MTPTDEFAVRVAEALRTGTPPVPDGLLPSIATRTAGMRQQRYPGLMSFTRIVLQGGAALAVGWLAITLIQGMRVSTGPFDYSTRGDFTLTLSIPRDTYRVGEVIEPVATLTYRGPQMQTDVSTAFLGPLYFGAEREGGPRITPGWRDSCEKVTMVRGAPLEVGFSKSGAFGPGTAHSDFIEWYLNGGQPLTLTPGTWRLYVIGHFNEGGCGEGEEPDMRASVTVVVEDGPLAASDASGSLRLTLSVPRTVYHVGDQIEATALIEYLGDGQQVISAGESGLVGFGAALGHGGAITPPFVRGGCATTATLLPGQPVTVPYQLDPRAVRFQPGLFEIAAVTDFAASDDCSGPRIKLRAVVAIEIHS